MDTNLPKPGQFWQHFKGHKYHVAGVFKHSETLELMVAYISVDNPWSQDGCWVRPATMWNDHIERETPGCGGIKLKYSGPRFKLIEDGTEELRSLRCLLDTKLKKKPANSSNDSMTT